MPSTVMQQCGFAGVLDDPDVIYVVVFQIATPLSSETSLSKGNWMGVSIAALAAVLLAGILVARRGLTHRKQGNASLAAPDVSLAPGLAQVVASTRAGGFRDIACPSCKTLNRVEAPSERPASVSVRCTGCGAQGRISFKVRQ